MTMPLLERSGVGLSGRLRTTVREAGSGLLVAELVHANLETNYALNSVATWLVGGGGVVVPAAPSYLALGVGKPNLLSAAGSDFESGTGGWLVDSNCTLAQSSAQAFSGLYSLQLTAASAANMSAVSPTGTSGVPVTGGSQYAASVHYYPASTVRQVQTYIRWFDSTGATISTVSGTPVTQTAGTWTRHYAFATAPTNAAYASVIAQVIAAANAEVHYIDAVQLEYAPDAPSGFQTGGQTSTVAATDTGLWAERTTTRAAADTVYTQNNLAVLLHTYQTTDPSGSFSEAGLYDQQAATTTLAAQAAVGATTLSLAAGAPAVAAGQQIYFPAAAGLAEYATVKTAAGAGASSWTLTDQLLLAHASGANVTVFNGNLWAHVVLAGVSKTGTQLLTAQWEIQAQAV